MQSGADRIARALPLQDFSVLNRGAFGLTDRPSQIREVEFALANWHNLSLCREGEAQRPQHPDAALEAIRPNGIGDWKQCAATSAIRIISHAHTLRAWVGHRRSDDKEISEIPDLAPSGIRSGLRPEHRGVDDRPEVNEPAEQDNPEHARENKLHKRHEHAALQ
jgi:hypothetical protein